MSGRIRLPELCMRLFSCMWHSVPINSNLQPAKPSEETQLSRSHASSMDGSGPQLRDSLCDGVQTSMAPHLSQTPSWQRGWGKAWPQHLAFGQKKTFLLGDMEPSLPSPVHLYLAERSWGQWDAVGTGAVSFLTQTGITWFVSCETSLYCKLVKQVGWSLGAATLFL